MSQLSEWFIANRLSLNLKKLVIVYLDLSRELDQDITCTLMDSKCKKHNVANI